MLVLRDGFNRIKTISFIAWAKDKHDCTLTAFRRFGVLWVHARLFYVE